MSDSVIKSNIVTYLLPIVILCYTFSVMWGWLPITSTIYVLFIGLIACIMLCRGYHNTKMFVFLVWLEIVLAMNMMAKDPLHNSTTGFLFEMLELSITSMMGYYFLRYGDEAIKKITVLMLLWMLVINAIGSSFVESIFPGSIRAVVSEYHKTGSWEKAFSFYRYGMASYNLVHAIPTIIPMLVFGAKMIKKTRTRIFFMIVLFSCIVLCYLGGSTTALICAIFALIISLFTRAGVTNRRQMLLFAVLAGLLVLIVSNDALVLSILDWADGLVGDESAFHSKIMDFKSSIIYDSTSDTSVQGRGDLYKMSIDIILTNPILGTNSNIIGRHSTMLDHWACLGLVGFIPYLLFIWHQLKWSNKYIPAVSSFFFIEGILMALIMLFVKSIDSWESWLFLFVLLPLLAWYIESIAGKNY